MRNSIEGTYTCSVPLHPLTLPITLWYYPQTVATATGAASATHGQKKEYETYYAFAGEKASDVKEKLAVKLNADPETIRLWDFYSAAQMAIMDENKTLSDCNIVEKNTILVEYQHPFAKKWLVEGPRTFGLSSYSTGSSGYSSYSSSGYGYNSAPTTRAVVPGKQGLGNLGNTCFMNSGLQCLSACVPLTDYFLTDRFKSEINRDNPIGAKGLMAEAYGGLLRELWASTSSSSSSYYGYSYGGVQPRQLKGVVERFAPQFAGYQQQDSQELLAFLLDGLHEDLNRILRKPYVEGVTGTPLDKDEEVAAKAWHGHKQRNDSFVVDHFQGQLKSKVVCPHCANVSITFDPFMYLSLPLPIDTSRWVKCIFVPLSGLPTRHAISCKATDTLDTLLRLLTSQLNDLHDNTENHPAQRDVVLTANNAVFCELNYGTFYERKKFSDVVDSLEAREVYYIYELHIPTEEELAASKPSKPQEKPSEEGEEAKMDVEGAGNTKKDADSDDEEESGAWAYLPSVINYPESYGYSNYVSNGKAHMPFVISVPNGCTWKTLYERICIQLAPYANQEFPDYDKVIAEYRIAEAEYKQKVAEEKLERAKEAEEKKAAEAAKVAAAAAATAVEGETTAEDGAEKETEKMDVVEQPKEDQELDEVENGGRRSPDSSDDEDPRGRTSYLSYHSTRPYDNYGRTSYGSAYSSYGQPQRPSTPPSAVPPLAPPAFPFYISVTKRYSAAAKLDPTSDAPIRFGNADEVSYIIYFANKTLFNQFIDENRMKTIDEHPSVAKQSRAAMGSTSAEAPMPLTDCLDLFCTEEQLTEENMWYCSKCKDHVRAIKKLELWSLPRILVVHLKRFHYGSRNRRDKISTLVQFPLENLDLGPYLLGHLEGLYADGSLPADGAAPAEAAAAAAPLYDLFAVSNHYGGMGGGHYTAYAKYRDDGSWHYYDDSSVRASNPDDVQSTAAYVLFYHRKDVPWPKFDTTATSTESTDSAAPAAAASSSSAQDESSSEEDNNTYYATGRTVTVGNRTFHAPANSDPSSSSDDEEAAYKRGLSSSSEDDDTGAGAGAGAGGDDDLSLEPHRVSDNVQSEY